MTRRGPRPCGGSARRTGLCSPFGKIPVGRDGAELLARLEGVAASTGSACHAGRVELSPVLAAMRVPEHAGMGAVRFSLGRGTTGDEVDSVVSRLAGILGNR